MSALAQKYGGKTRRKILRGRDASSDTDIHLIPSDRLRGEIADLREALSERTIERNAAQAKLDAIRNALDDV